MVTQRTYSQYYPHPDDHRHRETDIPWSQTLIIWELMCNSGRRLTENLALETRRSSDTNFDTNLGTLLRTSANSLVRWRRNLSASAISDGPHKRPEANLMFIVSSTLRG